MLGSSIWGSPAKMALPEGVEASSVNLLLFGFLVNVTLPEKLIELVSRRTSMLVRKVMLVWNWMPLVMES